MVICKYYLQGYCAFGNRCRFEHTLSTGANRTSGFGGQYGYRPLYQNPPRYRQPNVYVYRAPNYGHHTTNNFGQPNVQPQKNPTSSIGFSFLGKLNEIQSQDVSMDQESENINYNASLVSMDQNMEDETSTKHTFFPAPEKQEQMNFSFLVSQDLKVNESPLDPEYTPINELGEEELEQYRSNTFKLRSIPLNAPPKELCF